MKINELIKVGDVVKSVTRDMTDEEIAEIKTATFEAPEAEPTVEERLDIMEDAFAELCEVIFNG